jgi:hypothetical protein
LPSFTMSLREKTIIDRLNQESDRAVAIIGGCILEDRIEASLKARMIIDKKVGGELFGVARPPGSFSAKNDLAFLLRCYGPKLHRELATVNSIRNKFAHYFESKGNEVHDFKSQLIIDLCKNLTLVEGYVLSTTAFNEKYGARESASEVPAGTSWCDNPDTILKDYRERFITTIGIFTAYLGVYPKEDTYIQLVDDEPKPLFEIPA